MVRDEKRDARVLELFEQGLSREEIKRKCHLGCQQTVTDILRRYGKSYKARDKMRADENMRKAVEMYLAGYTIPEIARELGSHVSAVHALIEKSEIVLPEQIVPKNSIPYQMRVEWTVVVNMFRTQVMHVEPFQMPMQ